MKRIKFWWKMSSPASIRKASKSYRVFLSRDVGAKRRLAYRSIDFCRSGCVQWDCTILAVHSRKCVVGYWCHWSHLVPFSNGTEVYVIPTVHSSDHYPTWCNVAFCIHYVFMWHLDITWMSLKLVLHVIVCNELLV